MDDKLSSSLSNTLRLRNVRVLDVGMGLGDLSANLSALGCEVIPVRIPTRWSLRGVGPRADSSSNTLQADGEHLPLADQSIDVVISLQNLEYVANPQAMVQEIFRVLKPGGQFYAAWQNGFFSQQPISEFVTAAGFENVAPEKIAESLSVMTGKPSRLSRLLGAVSPALAATCDRWLLRCQTALQTVSYVFVTKPLVPARNSVEASETLFALGTALNQHRPIRVESTAPDPAETAKHKTLH